MRLIDVDELYKHKNRKWIEYSKQKMCSICIYAEFYGNKSDMKNENNFCKYCGAMMDLKK